MPLLSLKASAFKVYLCDKKFEFRTQSDGIVNRLLFAFFLQTYVVFLAFFLTINKFTQIPKFDNYYNYTLLQTYRPTYKVIKVSHSCRRLLEK